MLSKILPERFFIWFRKLSAPLPEDINKYLDPTKSFIDIGAGNGYFLSSIKATQNLSAVEIWDKQIKYLKEHFPNVSVYSGIEQLKAQYDVVACIDVIHHVEDKVEQKKFLEKLFKVVKPGGFLIIKEMRDDLLIHKYFNRISDFVSTGSKTNELSSKKLRDLLENNGYEIKRFKKFTALLYAHYYLVALKKCPS